MNTLGRLFVLIFNILLFVIAALGYVAFYIVRWVIGALFRIVVIILLCSIIYYILKEENLIQKIWTQLVSLL